MVSVTVAKCALLLESLDFHRCSEEFIVLSLGEAGEWMFRDFKNLLYGSFEASFLSVQAYLMSAMITSKFVVLVNDVLLVLVFVTFTMAKCALVFGIPCVGVLHMLHSLVSWGIGQLRPWRCGHVRVTRFQGSGLRCTQVAFL